MDDFLSGQNSLMDVALKKLYEKQGGKMIMKYASREDFGLKIAYAIKQ